ncbi:MAG: lipopolysaccharide kinase InaA family protein [Thermoguttaceae bacterium]
MGDHLADSPLLAFDPGGTGLPALDAEPVWASPEYLAALREAGLAGFEAVMASRQGHCMRSLKVRENWQLPLTVGRDSRTVFLKKHHVRSWGTRMSAWLGMPHGRSAARTEAVNIRRLQSAGIPCLELAAFGERLRRDGLLESFLVTPELEGFAPLDDFLRGHFSPPGADGPPTRDRALEDLVARVAALARQFHEAGFNHRDLYCCHFFVRRQLDGQFEIRLIDLQRVERRRRRRRRWLVKDLAQLAYSAPRDRITCTQKMRFIRRYLGVDRLRPEHKRLIREILAKQQSMERKLGLIA